MKRIRPYAIEQQHGAFQVPRIATGTVVLYDEAALLGTFDQLRFVGAGVTLGDFGYYAEVNIPGGAGGGGGGIGLFFTEDGVPLGTGVRLDSGYGLDLSISGTTVRIQVAPAISGSVILRDEGVLLGSVRVFDFVGPGVSASQAGGLATIAVPGPGVDQIGFFALDNGLPLGTGTRLNSGYGIRATLSGTSLEIEVETPVSGTLVIRDEGITQGSAPILDFVGAGVTAAVGGGVATITIPGAAGGLFFTEDGVPLGTGVRLDSGYGLDLSISGTTVRIQVAPPISGSVILSDEGNLLGSVSRLNFVGPGVSASLAGGVGMIAVPGPGVDQIGIFGTDDGVPLGTGTRLESGYGIDASLSGTVLEIRVETPVTGTVVLRDEGITQGSAPIMDFVGAGVTAAVAGGVATITIPGGAGGGGIGLFFTENGVPLGTGVRLDTGYGLDISISGTTVRMDVRPPITGSIVLRDEGNLLGSVTEMNFVGPGVSASQAGGVATVSIPGVGVDQIGLFFTEDGVPIGTGVRLDSGYGLDLSISGTTVRLDIRPPISGTVVLSDEGNILGSVSRLNFVGPGVSASLAAGVGTVAIPGPGVDQIGMFGLDDGVPLGTGTRIDAGYGIDLSLSGTTFDVKAEPPITGSIVLSDEGVRQGSVLDIDFVGAGVTASISGTRGQISIPGGASNPPISGSIVVSDEGIRLGSALDLDFVGGGVTATISGTRARISIAGGGVGLQWRLLGKAVIPTGSIAMGIQFASIPQDGEALMLLGVISTDEPNAITDDVGIRFNGDSGTNYDTLRVAKTSTFDIADNLINQKLAVALAAGGAKQDRPALNQVIIGGYSSPTIAKAALAMAANQVLVGTGVFAFRNRYSVWNSLAPITQIDIEPLQTGTPHRLAGPTEISLYVLGSGTAGVGAGGGVGVIIADEGIPVGSALELDFVGGGVTASISGTRARIAIAGGGIGLQWKMVGKVSILTGSVAMGLQFMDIPQDGEALMLLGVISTNSPIPGVNNVGLRFDGDSGSVYDSFLWAKSSSQDATADIRNAKLAAVLAGNSAKSRPNQGGFNEAMIANYASSGVTKSVFSLAAAQAAEGTGSFFLLNRYGVWNRTSPIVQIDIEPFATGILLAGPTELTLYVLGSGTVGAGVGNATLLLQEEGIPLGGIGTLGFVGVGAIASISGSVGRVLITGQADRDVMDYRASAETGRVNVDRWHFPSMMTAGAFTSGSIGRGEMYFLPFLTREGVLVDRIGINVVVANAGAGRARLGVYSNFSRKQRENWQPRTLLAETDPLDVTGVGIKTGTLNAPGFLMLEPDEMYWLALLLYSGDAIIRIATLDPKCTFAPMGMETLNSAFTKSSFTVGYRSTGWITGSLPRFGLMTGQGLGTVTSLGSADHPLPAIALSYGRLSPPFAVQPTEPYG